MTVKVRCSFVPPTPEGVVPRRKLYKAKINLRETLFEGNWLIALDSVAVGLTKGQERKISLLTNLSKHEDSFGDVIKSPLKYLNLANIDEKRQPMHANFLRNWIPVTHPNQHLEFSTADLDLPALKEGKDMVYATLVLKRVN